MALGRVKNLKQEHQVFGQSFGNKWSAHNGPEMAVPRHKKKDVIVSSIEYTLLIF